MLVGRVPRWLRNTFQPDVTLSAPIRYRFDVAGSARVNQDVVVAGDGYTIEPISDSPPTVTFGCNSSDYILLIFGRLDLEKASAAGNLRIEGSREQASLFNTWFQGV